MKKLACLFVTCCMERSRFDILNLVVPNLLQQAPELATHLTVFDNASTVPGTIDLLKANFKNVYRCDRNVGYWTAIDWWLTSLQVDPPEYTYIIESDMVHWAFQKTYDCVRFLDRHPEVGAVRLQEFSVENRHLYNKDAPRPDSRRSIWQAGSNRVTGKRLTFDESDDAGIYFSNFLTQLPALNRYTTMVDVFRALAAMERFSESDFQRMYHERYPLNAILDGGTHNSDPGGWQSKTVTGSWSSEAELRSIGYQSTRYSSIGDPSTYSVTLT